MLLCITMVIGRSVEIINTKSNNNTHRISTISAILNLTYCIRPLIYKLTFYKMLRLWTLSWNIL